ncbi:MAG: kynureninase [Pseudomonadales bacterium]
MTQADELRASVQHSMDLDARDSLAGWRQQFTLAGDEIYLDGNSLGPMPRCVPAALETTLRSHWQNDLIRSWNDHGWIDLPITLGEKIAPLLGAAPGQVVCTDSTSINLFKVLHVAMQIQGWKGSILSEADNFPTDLYMAENLRAVAPRGALAFERVASEDLAEAIDGSVSVLLLSHVNFRTGALHDLVDLTARAHQAGALVIWDLSHSAGVMKIELDACQVDFAVGCGYKFLNGGPGAPGYIYVAERHQNSARQPLWGWMGHAEPFQFAPRYEPAPGIKRYLTGTPAILSMVALDAALAVFDDLDLTLARQKSKQLGEHLKDLITVSGVPLKLLSPSDAEARGSQVSFTHHCAYGVVQALIELGVIGDFRAPNIIRFGLNPLFNSFQDIERAVVLLKQVFDEGRHLERRFDERKPVT